MRKYQYKDRQTAENAVLDQSHQRHLLYRGLRALERKEVCWTSRLGNYQVGIFDADSPTGPRCLVRFYGNGQVETDAHDYEEWAAQWRTAFIQPHDTELEQLWELCLQCQNILRQAAGA
jgi:hypothetical protein